MTTCGQAYLRCVSEDARSVRSSGADVNPVIAIAANTLLPMLGVACVRMIDEPWVFAQRRGPLSGRVQRHDAADPEPTEQGVERTFTRYETQPS